MPVSDRTPQTLYDKVLSHHVVDEKLDGTILLYIGTPRSLLGSRVSARLTWRLVQTDTWFTR